MLKMPFANRYWPIALDIGSDSTKMLQLQTVGGELSVRACSRWQLPAAARQDPQRKRELTVSAVRDMLRNGRFKGKRVVTALPCWKLHLRSIRVPKMPAEELAEAVKWEAAERFSFDVSPDRLRHVRAGEIRQGTEVLDEVIMMAVDQETIDSHISILAEAGLYSEHIGAEPIELLRAFSRRPRRQTDDQTVTVILEIGSCSTRVVVGCGRKIVFMKNIEIGGRRLTEAAARQLNLSVEEAEQLRWLVMKEHAAAVTREDASKPADSKGKVSESVAWTIHDAVRGELESLGREVALCLRYCTVTFRGLRPQTVIVTGGQAYDPFVIKLLSEQLGMECVIGRPLRGINVSGANFGDNGRGTLSEWALCAGMAVWKVEGKDRADEAGDREHRLSA